MAFLNHATNNIIIDAVLTEKGRELLAQNRNSFQITKFAFGDDEVDYSLITKYGIRVGKEKIEKNTPIFEALTGQNMSLKYPLFTGAANLANSIKYMPLLKRIDTNGNSLVYSTRTTNSINIQLKTSVDGYTINDTLDAALQDTTFMVYYDNRFLKSSSNQSVTNEDEYIDSVTINTLSPSTLDFNGQKQFDFKIIPSSMLNTDIFDRYGYGSSKEIRTQVHIIGKNSGTSITLPINITMQ